jgi:hypothetical protein
MRLLIVVKMTDYNISRYIFILQIPDRLPTAVAIRLR